MIYTVAEQYLNYNLMNRRNKRTNPNYAEDSGSQEVKHRPRSGSILTRNDREKRSNVIERNYVQDFSNEVQESQPESTEYVFFKGGRVSKTIAQRTNPETGQIQKLCKFYNKSYLHVQWLTPQLCTQKNIQMIRQNKRIQSTRQRVLEQTQQKYGSDKYFPPSYTRVDRILTTAVLFPLMHHKKGSQMNGKWSEMMMLVCAKVLNFQKDHVAYGVVEKDDYYPEGADEKDRDNGTVNKVKIQHVVNRVYLDRYQNSQQFWKDMGECVRSLEKKLGGTGLQHNADILKECVIFLYWQWFCLSRQRFLSFLPKTQKYQKTRHDLQLQTHILPILKFHTSPSYNFSKFTTQNIFLRENYGQAPTTQQQLLLLHPGKFSYNWLTDPTTTDLTSLSSISLIPFHELNENDLQKLDLNVEIDALYLVKWCDLDYDQVTWEKESQLDCKEMIENFKQYSKIPPKKDRERFEENKKYHKAIPKSMLEGPNSKQSMQTIQKCKKILYHLSSSTKQKQIKQYGGEDIPVYKGYRILKNFQVEGLNWLIKNWHIKKNCILADEMGLGKTIQTIAFLNHLHVFQNVLGPFLIVAPVSTLKQWRNQIQHWSDLNCVLYKGKKQARDLIQEYQFYHKFVTNQGIFVKFQKLPRFQVMLTNYEIFVSDIEMFQKISFQHIIMDQAHKMKNSKSRIAQTLKTLPCPRILLLTGTPIQNNTSQIFGLLNIIQQKFNSLQDFKNKFGNLKTSQQLNQLKQTLKPYLLRRVKSDVQKSIPKLSEMLVNLDLTKIQKTYYRGILEKNKNNLLGSLNCTAINNVTLCLRQCCNHPYMLSGDVEDQITANCDNEEERFEKFINSSSKLIFVHKFLEKCREKGTKTLIFTQFLEMVRLLRQYCIHNNIQFETLDGSVHYEQRQNRIDRFNTNPKVSVFIISTKAGGMGINLTSATNIIIYDSDWNPQNDIQAIARAHRIGQHKNVTVYRLVTIQTYEDILYKSAVKKLGIGLAILDNQFFNNSDVKDPKKQKSKEEVEKLLRDGVIGFLRSQENGRDDKNGIQNESIEDIITKSCTSVDYQTKDCSFSSTKFEHEAENDKNLSVNDPHFWQVALENVQSPLQKLVKKLKNDQQAKKIFEDVDQQLELMIQANEVVFNFVRSKVSMSHFNAQDERQLRSFLEKITYSRQFVKKFKNIANDWLQEIEKPSRRFEKCDINILTEAIKSQNKPNQRIIRTRQKPTKQDDTNQIQANSPQTTAKQNKKNRMLDSSEEKSNHSMEENKKQLGSEDEDEENRPGRRKRKGRNMRKMEEEEEAAQEELEEVQGQKCKFMKYLPKNADDVKKYIVDNLAFYLERICVFCERKVCSKLCKGRCKRSFHEICYQKYKQKTTDKPNTSDITELRLSKLELCQSLSDKFECFECQLGEAICFICGIPGQVIPSAWKQKSPKNPLRLSGSPTSRNEIQKICQTQLPQQSHLVFQCRMDYCTKCYHLSCLKSLQESRSCIFQVYCNREHNSYPLKCPAHFCNACVKKLTVVKCSCLRCPLSYHMRCKGRRDPGAVDVDAEWFVCGKHQDGQGENKKEKMDSKRVDKEGEKLRREKKKEKEKEKEKQRDEIVEGNHDGNIAIKMEKSLKGFEEGEDYSIN